MDKQIQIIRDWTQDLHETLAMMLETNSKKLSVFDENLISNHVHRLLSTPSRIQETYDLIITGSLGKLSTRLVALQAQSMNIPVMTIYHGAAYPVFDEPLFQNPYLP